MQAVLYEFPSVPLVSSNGMATVESLNKEVSALAQRVTAVETELRIWGKVIGGFSTAGLLVGMGALGWSVHIGNKVTAIEQQLVDGGNTKLVSELKLPKSPQQLQANLTMVTAQIRTARANGTKPNAQKVAALSDALSAVVQKDPNLPEAWQAATELVTYRSTQPATIQKACFGKSMSSVLNNSVNGIKLPDSLSDIDCSIDLGDIESFKSNPDIKDLKLNLDGTLSSPLGIELTHAHVIYHGGPIIPFTILRCVACTYDFGFSTPPPVPAQKLTRQLLIAEDFADIKVDSRGAA